MPYQLRVTCALTASEQPILAPQVIVFPESVSPDELHQAGAAYPEALLVGAILVTLRLLVFLAKHIPSLRPANVFRPFSLRCERFPAKLCCARSETRLPARTNNLMEIDDGHQTQHNLSRRDYSSL